MSGVFLILIILAVLIISIGSAVVRHEGDLFAWGHHPRTRVVFAAVGLLLIGFTVVPEIRRAGQPPAAIEAVQITVPEQALADRFPHPEVGRGRQDITWSGGRVIVSLLYLNGYGQVVDGDSRILDWDGETDLRFTGNKDLYGRQTTCSVSVREIGIRWRNERCVLSLSGNRDVEVSQEGRGGSYSSSGGLGEAVEDGVFLLDSNNDFRDSGFRLRRGNSLRQIGSIVLLVHPLTEAHSATQTQAAQDVLGPYMNRILYGGQMQRSVRDDQFRYLYHRSSPAFFNLIDQVGPAPFVLLAGFVLLGLAVPRYRGRAVLLALFLNSLTLVAVDGYVTRTALDVAERQDLTGFQQAEMIDRAGGTFFHAGMVAKGLRKLFESDGLQLEARASAWVQQIVAEVEQRPEHYRDGLRSVATGYCHEYAESWYSVWIPKVELEPVTHLLVVPDAHGHPFGPLRYRAALAVAEVPPGIVVMSPPSRFTGAERFHVVAGAREIPAFLRLVRARPAELKESALWHERIAPLMRSRDNEE